MNSEEEKELARGGGRGGRSALSIEERGEERRACFNPTLKCPLPVLASSSYVLPPYPLAVQSNPPFANLKKANSFNSSLIRDPMFRIDGLFNYTYTRKYTLSWNLWSVAHHLLDFILFLLLILSLRDDRGEADIAVLSRKGKMERWRGFLLIGRLVDNFITGLIVVPALFLNTLKGSY